MAAVTELAARDAADIAREEIARMKQRFYAIRKTELDAELEAYIAEGNPAEEFKPALDPAEEEFKTLLNNIKEKKAVLAAKEDAERQANLERKRAPHRRTAHHIGGYRQRKPRLPPREGNPGRIQGHRRGAPHRSHRDMERV